MVLLGSNVYSRSMYVNYLILAYHKRGKTAFWDMLKQNICVLNEEVCEQSFAVLSRCTLGDTTVSKFKHLDMMYSLMHIYRQINSDVADDIGLPNQKSGIEKIKKNSVEIQTVSGYFLNKIVECQKKSFREYKGDKKSFKSKFAGIQGSVINYDPKLYWRDSIADTLTTHKLFMQESIESYWLTDFIDLWPESKEQVVPMQGDVPFSGRIPQHAERVIDLSVIGGSGVGDVLPVTGPIANSDVHVDDEELTPLRYPPPREVGDHKGKDDDDDDDDEEEHDEDEEEDGKGDDDDDEENGDQMDYKHHDGTEGIPEASATETE